MGVAESGRERLHGLGCSTVALSPVILVLMNQLLLLCRDRCGQEEVGEAGKESEDSLPLCRSYTQQMLPRSQAHPLNIPHPRTYH